MFSGVTVWVLIELGHRNFSVLHHEEARVTQLSEKLADASAAGIPMPVFSP